MLRLGALTEHVDCFLQLRQQVDLIHYQRHAAALHAGKLQQLLDNAGQPFAFADDDAPVSYTHLFSVIAAAGALR